MQLPNPAMAQLVWGLQNTPTTSLQRDKTLLDMTQNNLMVRLQ